MKITFEIPFLSGKPKTVLTNEAALFSAEAPITTAAQDLLGRKAFSESIAKVLSNWTGDHSLVVALRGPWGSGKSSVKNLITEVIEVQSPPTTVLHFNPWQYDEGASITAAFYREIGSALGQTKDPLKGWERRHALKQYASYFTAIASPLKKASENLLKWFGWLAAAGLISVGILQFVTPGWLKLGATILTCLGGGSWLIGKLLTAFAGSEKPDKPIRLVRTHLEKVLKKLERPLIVVIDDIDRLEPESIRLIFRHVKVNADLPNISYLLLFQKDIVENALAPVSGDNGRQYLEKIVQASFDIPTVEGARVEKVLFDALNRIFENVLTTENGFEQVRWGNIYHGGMKRHFRTLRDVHRYTAAAAVQAKLHEGSHTFEVNVVDLMALETLRLFEPEVFEAIARNKDLLTKTHHAQVNGDAERIRNIIPAELPADRRAAIEPFLRELFPSADWAFQGGMHYDGEFAVEWSAQKRVCSRRMFDRYFTLRLPDDMISESEFAEVLAASHDRDRLDSLFASLKERGLLSALMNRFDEIRSSLPLANIGTLAPAIMDLAETLERTSGLFGAAPYTAGWRSVFWYMLQTSDLETRGQFFLDALLRAQGLSVAATLISIDAGRDGKRSPPERTLMTDTQRARAELLWVIKLKAKLPDVEALISHPQFVSLLFRWREFENEQVVRSWLAEVTQTDRNLVKVLEGFEHTRHMQTWGDHVSTAITELSVRDVSQLFDLNELTRRLSHIPANSLPEALSVKVPEYMRLLQRELDRRAGIAVPDDDD
ncbi:P-loop NTPase fold protein [Asticcacaulis sp. YBE204]|uniref:KAP family P-loop NTPase fold protein n=1 Tax=Asticcacaulis sp. YBE204 TaxID=1282363 RepID=UPI00138AF4AB|nr:P-loop NTPase fold protein [Asticcacaulis sp. YBE204]